MKERCEVGAMALRAATSLLEGDEEGVEIALREEVRTRRVLRFDVCRCYGV